MRGRNRRRHRGKPARAATFELGFQGRIARGLALRGDSGYVETALFEFGRSAVGKELAESRRGNRVFIGTWTVCGEVANAKAGEDPRRAAYGLAAKGDWLPDVVLVPLVLADAVPASVRSFRSPSRTGACGRARRKRCVTSRIGAVSRKY